MSLTVLACNPTDLQLNIPLDTPITLTFSQAIDPFTVKNGIALYYISGQTWVGTELAILDNKTQDINSNVSNQYVDFSYTLSLDKKVLTITPSDSLKDNTQYYLQIFPGTDATRFLSSATVNTPVYTKNLTTPSEGTIDIVSPFVGKTAGTYVISITSPTTADVIFNGVPQNSITFTNNIPVSLGNLSVTFDSLFDINDIITIDVFVANGLTSIFKSTYTTSVYETFAVQSSRIEDTIYELTVGAFKAISIYPQDKSINNASVNPITIKFNKPIKNAGIDLTKHINITKKDMDSGLVKRINYFYVVDSVNQDTVKLYLDSVTNAPMNIVDLGI